MFERYSILARQAVIIARMEAGRAGVGSLDTEHMLLGIVCVNPEVFKQLKVDVLPDPIRARSRQWHPSSDPIPESTDLPITSDMGNVFERAASISDGQRCQEIRTEHLLLSMLEGPGHAAGILADLGIAKEQLLTWLESVVRKEPQIESEASLKAMKLIFPNETNAK